jgi:hypothetical protein
MYLLIDGRLLGTRIIPDDQFPAMLDTNPQVTEMIVTLYASAGLTPPYVPPAPEALGSERHPAPEVWEAATAGRNWPQPGQPSPATDVNALYAFQIWAEGAPWIGPYDRLPDGQFGTGLLSFHPPCAHRNQFYGQELLVRYGPWDGDTSFHTFRVRPYTLGDPIRVRSTCEVVNWLFDQRQPIPPSST